MKRAFRILLIVLLIAAVVAAALAWHYRDYLRAFSDAKQYSSEDLQQQMDDNESALEEILSQYLPDLTQQTPDEQPQESSTQNGVISETVDQQPAMSPQKPSTEQPTPKEEPKVDPEVTKIVGEFNSLRSEYLDRLDGMKNRAYDEYTKRSFSKKELIDFVAGFVRQATVLEVECDDSVFALLSQLEKVIEKNGGDSTLPDRILDIYLTEKQLTKAKYISELEKRGLIV